VPTGGLFLTDLLVDVGQNEVAVTVPMDSLYDEEQRQFDVFTAELGWRRADL